METEFNLSEKIEHSYDAYCGTGTDLINPEDVKEFIRLLKEEIHIDIEFHSDIDETNCYKVIDKLSGEKLIWITNT